MNPHLKLAYEQGVQKALEDTGLTKESRLGTATMQRIKDALKNSYTSVAEARPVTAITGRRLKGLEGSALENEQAVVDAARAYGLLGTGVGTGAGYYALSGDAPPSRSANLLESLLG